MMMTWQALCTYAPRRKPSGQPSEHSRYASVASLSTGWELSLILLDRYERVSDRLVDRIRLLHSNFRVSSLILTWLALYVRFLSRLGVLLT